jgi:hypothetical protein
MKFCDKKQPPLTRQKAYHAHAPQLLYIKNPVTQCSLTKRWSNTSFNARRISHTLAELSVEMLGFLSLVTDCKLLCNADCYSNSIQLQEIMNINILEWHMGKGFMAQLEIWGLSCNAFSTPLQNTKPISLYYLWTDLHDIQISRTWPLCPFLAATHFVNVPHPRALWDKHYHEHKALTEISKCIWRTPLKSKIHLAMAEGSYTKRGTFFVLKC